MRVIAGEFRGRRLIAPDGEGTRPTADRVKEAVFNALFSLDAIDGARVLDLFAGSGGLGIEALSRGAAHVTFVESDRRAADALRTNLENFGLGPRATVVIGDALTQLARLGGPFDLVLLDPPYAFAGWDDLLPGIDGGVVVIESDREVTPPSNWTVHRVKRYGGTVVTLTDACPQGEPPS